MTAMISRSDGALVCVAKNVHCGGDDDEAALGFLLGEGSDDGEDSDVEGDTGRDGRRGRGGRCSSKTWTARASSWRITASVATFTDARLLRAG